MEEQLNLFKLPPIVKNRPGKYVGSKQRKFIVDLYKRIKTDWPRMPYKDVIRFLWKRTGIGRVTICRTLAEFRRNGRVMSPKRKRNKTSIIQRLSEQQEIAIKRKVHEFWFKSEVPNLNRILNAVNSDPALPKFSRTTLHRVLQHLNFEYTLKKRKRTIIEREDVIQWRRDYWNKLRQYKEEGRPIYYLHKTWVSVGDNKKRLQRDKSLTSGTDAPAQNPSTSIQSSTEKGKKVIMKEHIASKDNFTHDEFSCFEAKENTVNQDEKLSSNSFLYWFQRILQSLENGSVIIMDNGLYHCAKTDLSPSVTWTKQQMIEWLESRGIEVLVNSQKTELIEIIKQIDPEYDKNVVDDFVKQQDKIILRLPPYQ